MRKSLILIILLFVFNGCNKQDEEVIGKVKLIGVIAPLTGAGATYGRSMKRGVELVFKGNNKYKIIYEDSKLST